MNYSVLLEKIMYLLAPLSKTNPKDKATVDCTARGHCRVSSWPGYWVLPMVRHHHLTSQFFAQRADRTGSTSILFISTAPLMCNFSLKPISLGFLVILDETVPWKFCFCYPHRENIVHISYDANGRGTTLHGLTALSTCTVSVEDYRRWKPR